MSDHRLVETMPLFLGRKADQLSLLIENQLIPVYLKLGIVIPVRSCSLVTVLADLGAGSAADIARGLGQSHQLVLQKVPALIKLKLLVQKPDPSDRRRNVFQLTPVGKKQVRLLARSAALIENAYETLNKEIGVDLFSALSRAIQALEQTSVESRLSSVDITLP